MIFVATHAETKTGNCKDLLEGYLAGRLSSNVGGNHVEALRREFKTSQEKAIIELKEKLEADIHTLKGRSFYIYFPKKPSETFYFKISISHLKYLF